MGRRWLVAAAAVVLGVGTGWFAVPAGAAQSSCVPHSKNITGAHTGRNSSVFGARARIEYNNPDLCSNDTTGSGTSAVWAMVTAFADGETGSTPDHPDRQGYAQVGYGQFASGADPTTGIWRIAQWSQKCVSHGTCGSNPTFDDVAHAAYYGHPTVAVYYANYLRSDDQHVHMTVDGYDLTETNYDPAGDWDAAWQGQYNGETHEKSSDVPGTAADPTSLDYLQKYSSTGSVSFFSSVVGYTQPSSRYHQDVYAPAAGGPGVKVWTDPLS